MSKIPIQDLLHKGTVYVCKTALRRKEKVYIYRTVETGDWLWAVALTDISDFWLNSFKTRREAVEYCRKHKLPTS